MRVQDLTRETLEASAAAGKLRIQVGPFVVGVRTSIAQITELLGLLYAAYPLGTESGYRDFQLAIARPRSLRRWVRPYATFRGQDQSPFEPLPLDSAFPLFEWGLNWSVATTAHQYLMLHAAVLQRDSVSILMPAIPGAGKSTLAAALMSRGWRLLSDEFGLIRPGTTALVPFPRPIPLKNQSIAVISEFDPEAVLGPVFRGTRKGDIAHCRPTHASVIGASDPTDVTHVVFPRFETGGDLRLTEIAKARAFMQLSANAFNYLILGERGFSTVVDIVSRSQCLSLLYSDLDAAIRVFDDLAA